MPHLKNRIYLMILGLHMLTILSISCSSHIPISSENINIKDVIRHPSFSEKVGVSIDWGMTKGIGIGFVWPEFRDTPPMERPQTLEVALEPEQPFAPFALLHSTEKTTFLVSVLLDYQQVSFELDGQMGLLHEVLVEPGGDLEIPIKVDVKQPGWHDLIILGFADPYNNSLDIEYRMSGRSAQLIGRRVFIKVGNEDSVANSLPAPITGHPAPNNVQLGFRANFATVPPKSNTHPSDIERQLYVGAGQADEDYNYQIFLSNLDGDADANYALMMFHNFHQVSIGNKSMVTVHLAPGEEVYFNAVTQLDKSVGLNQLQMVFIYDPYKPDQEVWLPFVYSSVRIAIVGE